VLAEGAHDLGDLFNRASAQDGANQMSAPTQQLMQRQR